MTATFEEVVLSETELLNPCHAVCQGLPGEEGFFGICGLALRGELASLDDMLCSDCIVAGEEQMCRHCHRACYGVWHARWS